MKNPFRNFFHHSQKTESFPDNSAENHSDEIIFEKKNPVEELSSEEEVPFIRLDDLAALAETSEDSEDEAPFIRVDDLAALAAKESPVTSLKKPAVSGSGLIIFTLIPRYRYQYITAAISRLIRKTLIDSAWKQHLNIEMTRVRPLYIQWEIKSETEETPDAVIAVFKKDLDDVLIRNQDAFFPERKKQPSFWADHYLIQKSEEAFSYKEIVKFINENQLIEPGGDKNGWHIISD